MADTFQQVSARVRVLLRRVDEQKLPDEDIRMVLLQCLRTALEEQNLTLLDRTTQRKPVSLSVTSMPSDFLINGLEAEMEIENLEYTGQVNNDTVATGCVTLVPLSAFDNHANSNKIVGSIYGGNHIRLNIGGTELPDQLTWTLTFRDSLLSKVQEGQRPPIPTNHLPMVEYDAAVKCAALVVDDSEEWKNWCEEWLKDYRETVKGLKAVWLAYLNTSLEPQVQPIVRSDRHRAGSRRTRAVIPAR